MLSNRCRRRRSHIGRHVPLLPDEGDEKTRVVADHDDDDDDDDEEEQHQLEPPPPEPQQQAGWLLSTPPPSVGGRKAIFRVWQNVRVDSRVSGHSKSHLVSSSQCAWDRRRIRSSGFRVRAVLGAWVPGPGEASWASWNLCTGRRRWAAWAKITLLAVSCRD